MQAIIRSDYPALTPALALLVGEACAGLGQNVSIYCLAAGIIAFTFDYNRVWALFGIIGFCLATQLITTMQTELLPDQDSYILRIISLPRYRTPGLVEFDVVPLARISTLPHYQFVSIDHRQVIACHAVELPWRNISKLGYGQDFIARLKIKALSADELSPYRHNLWRRGYSATCEITHSTQTLTPQTRIERLRAHLATTVRRQVGDNQTAGLFLGMALGMRDGITDHLERAFKDTTLAHLLVLSGYQVTLVACGIRVLARRAILLISKSGALILFGDLCGLAAALTLTLLTGVETAALRAVLALLIGVFAQRYDRRATLGGISISTLLLNAIFYPETPFDLSSLLTFGALCGITLGAARPSKFRVTAWLQILLYCSLTTSALSAIYFKTFCPAGVVFNAVFAPLLSVISCNIGLPALLLTMCGASIGEWALRQSAWTIRSCAELITSLADSPLAAWKLDPSSSVLVALVLASPLVVRFSRCLEHYLLSRGLYPSVATERMACRMLSNQK